MAYLLGFVGLGVFVALVVIFGLDGDTAITIIVAVVVVGFAALVFWAVTISRWRKYHYAQIGQHDYPQPRWQDAAPAAALFARYNTLDFGSQVREVDLSQLSADVRSDAVQAFVSKYVPGRRNNHFKKADYTIDHVRRAEHGGLPVTAFVHRASTTNLVVTTPIPKPRPFLKVEFTSHLNRSYTATTLDKRCSVDGDNERFTHDVLNPALAEFLLQDPRGAAFGFQVMGGGVTAWAEELDGSDQNMLAALADYLVQVVRRVPAGVWTA